VQAIVAKRKTHRAEFRKNRNARARATDWTRRLVEDPSLEDVAREERISGKGELTRRRTVRVTAEGADGAPVLAAEAGAVAARVIRVHGLTCFVRTEDGREFPCAVRRLLKTISIDQRHVVACGDRVQVRAPGAGGGDGLILSVAPRHGVLSRTSKGRRHLIVTNCDQVVIVASVAEPALKPGLIDRYLVTCEQNRLRPVICFNKVDLVDAADLQPLAGSYARMGYETLLVSAARGWNIGPLRRLLVGRQSVVTGQSGVGKSSLLNAVEPELGLRIGAVSEENEKGRHTTTTAVMIPLAGGGAVIDTPGIRQFALWDVTPNEVASCFADLRPLVNRCRFPNCSHTHESDCAIKDAAADGWLDLRRYESYGHLRNGDDD
jgi:ribosome biogenesis GTPase